MVEISTSNCGKTTQKIRFYQKIPRGKYGKKGAFSLKEGSFMYCGSCLYSLDLFAGE